MELLVDGQPIDAAPPLLEGQWAELSAVAPDAAVLELAVGGVALEPFLRPGDPAWRWRWLAPAAAGEHRLLLRAVWLDGRAEEQRAALVVEPRKLDAERYAAILVDLQRLGRALVFALAGGRVGVAPDPVPDLAPPTPAEELHTLFGDELLRLEGAVTRLARRPPDRLRPGEETVPLGRLREPARLRAVRPEHDEALLAASASSYDSYEARLLRRLLDNLWRRLELLTAALPSPLAASAATARERLRVMRAAPFLTGVPPLAAYTGPSARMQRDPDYRAVYRLWRLLRRRPLLSWDAATLSIPVGDLPRLYERWCAAAVALALLELPGRTVRAQSIVTAEGDDQLLALSDEAPLVALEGPGGALLRLRYQPRYRPLTSAFATARPSSFILHPSSLTLGSLDRHTRVPDLVIEVERQDATPALLILDAKYRLDATGGVPEAALADAYSYLSAIGSPAGERAALAVALLYPGHGPAETYASGVAALPLLPGADGALRAWLMAYLD